MDYVKLGTFLKEARMKKGINQMDVAAHMNNTPQSVSNWELGKSKIDIESLAKLCDLYDVDFSEALEKLQDRPKFNLVTDDKDDSYSHFEEPEVNQYSTSNNANYKVSKIYEPRPKEGNNITEDNTNLEIDPSLLNKYSGKDQPDRVIAGYGGGKAENSKEIEKVILALKNQLVNDIWQCELDVAQLRQLRAIIRALEIY